MTTANWNEELKEVRIGLAHVRMGTEFLARSLKLRSGKQECVDLMDRFSRMSPGDAGYIELADRIDQELRRNGC